MTSRLETEMSLTFFYSVLQLQQLTDSAKDENFAKDRLCVWTSVVVWILIQLDPKFLAGSGFGKNHQGSSFYLPF